MSVKIRCRRTGANNDPCFRIVATDSRSPRDGKCLETLGWYDPKKPGINFHLDTEKITGWKNKGAILSETVSNLMKKSKNARPEPGEGSAAKEFSGPTLRQA